jgi:hypothetical protein
MAEELYYVETWSRRYLFPAESTRDARMTVIYDFHDDGCRLIRKATPEDIASFEQAEAAQDDAFCSLLNRQGG